MDKKPATISISPSQRPKPPQQSPRDKRIFTDVTAYCQLMLEAGGALFEFPLPPKASPVQIGRDSQNLTSKSDIDLSPFNALEMGVSRSHARFERSGTRLFVRDLGSTNGTWVNGERLAVDYVHEVFHGDKIEFGRLAARLYIKVSS